MEAPRDARNGALALAGLALIVFGGWGFLREFIPSPVLDVINRSTGPIGLVLLGIVVILLSRRGRFTVPRTGTRLYRSRSDRMIAGVIGGLGAYLGVDPLILRVVTVLLTLMGAGALVVAYIVMWVLVPEEPLVPAPDPYAVPVPQAPPVPPAPPVPGA
jgi:phage shock protein C